MERLINRRQQGDLGEASALEWFTRQGATVFIPMGHSPDVDLIAMIDVRIVRVQVKTSTSTETTPNGYQRWSVAICTNGGNQSWTGVAKLFDPTKVDALFVLVEDGRRWLIPVTAIEGRRALRLGGPKYSEFEIESGRAIDHLVYGEPAAPLKSNVAPGERRSRRADPVCKIGASVLSGFDSHLPHSHQFLPRQRFQPSRYERNPGKRGEAVINQKRRVTLPQRALLESGLCDGDRVRARSDGPGRIVLEKLGLPVWAEPD
jgi:hypothetical protein